MTIVILTTASVSPWTVPGDWNNAANTIETIAGGGSGAVVCTATRNAAGGGGGAYNKATNVALSGTAQFQVGAGGAAVSLTAPTAANTNGNNGTDTWFNGTSLASASVSSQHGSGGSSTAANTNAAGGVKGAAASGQGSGNDGGKGGDSNGGLTASGGGGAGGPNGPGNPGVDNTTATTGTNGGSGDAGSGGTAGTGNSAGNGGNGGNGSELGGGAAGSGGGGGGAALNGSGTAITGGNGGNYGAGGGAAGNVNGGTAVYTSGKATDGVIVITYTPSGGATLVSGWQNQPYQPFFSKRFFDNSAPALALTPATLPAKISGQGWFNPPDRDPPPRRPTVEQLPALVLTPATLPVKVSGMGWFAPADRDPPLRRPILEQPPGWAAQPFVVSTAVPQGWQTSATEPVRRRAPPIDVPSKPPVFAAPTVPSGWWHGDDELPRRRAIASSEAAMPPRIVPAVGVSGIGWFNPPDRDPPPRRPTVEQLPALVLTPATLPVKISGMGWFTPLDDLPRKWKPLFDLAAWDPQLVGQIAPTGISGMAWFIPPAEFRPVAFRSNDQPSFVSPTIRATLGFAYTVTDDQPRRRRPSDDVPVWVATSPPVGSLGWLSPVSELLRRPAVNESAPALPARFVSSLPPIGWISQFDQLPPRRARALDVAAHTPKVPPPPVGISGMAWFVPSYYDRAATRRVVDHPPAQPWSFASSFVNILVRTLDIHGTMPPSEFGTVLPDAPKAASKPATDGSTSTAVAYRKLTDKGVLE